MSNLLPLSAAIHSLNRQKHGKLQLHNIWMTSDRAHGTDTVGLRTLSNHLFAASDM